MGENLRFPAAQFGFAHQNFDHPSRKLGGTFP
jgi:hypothetical protein